MRRINYKSDIPPLLLSLKVDENQITVPDCDFIVRFYIEGYEGRHYDCSHIGGVWSNCEPSEDGTKIVCYINNQRLGIGELCAEFHYISPDRRYSDGSQKSVVIIGSTELGVELVEDNGDAVTEAAIDVTLPFIYRTAYEIARDHGYTGTAEDFYGALASVVGIAEAEKNRVSSEITRNANEQERIENEENRLNAESERVNAEAQRVRNEAIRGNAESDRVEQEEDRKATFKEITEFIATVRANEGNRESNERERQANEDTRITEETKRVAAEKKRAAEFEQQKLDLGGKIDRSGDEMGGDLIFTDNAGVSFRTSDGGAHTMFNDTDDVAKFTSDNGDTFEFKQNETPNKNSYAVVVSANLYNALDMTLESMGSALDGDAAYRAEAGETIFNPDTCKIQRYNSTIGGFEDLCDPIDGKLYANKITGYIYRWDTKTNKMVFVGGVKAYTKDEADSRFAKLDDATQRVKVKELDAGNFVSAKSMWIGDEGLVLGGDGNGHLTVEQDEVITDVTLNEKLATKADDVAYGVEWSNGQPTGEIQETTVKDATRNTTVLTLFLEQSFNALESEVEKKADKTELDAKVDKTDIVQSTGTSTTAVMSQKAVSDVIAAKDKETDSEISSVKKIIADIGLLNNNRLLNKELHLTDEEGNVICAFKNGGIITKLFNSFNTVTRTVFNEKTDKIEDSIKDIDKVVQKKQDKGDYVTFFDNKLNKELHLTDEEGNVICAFKNGGIITKLFNSFNTVEIKKSSVNNNDFSIVDNFDNPILTIKNGGIFTRDFSSNDVKSLKYYIKEINEEKEGYKDLLIRKNVARISWIDDDFNLEEGERYYNTLFSLAKRYDIRPDIALIPNYELSENKQDLTRVYFSEEKLRKIQEWENDGYQFLLHPVHHGLYNSNTNNFISNEYATKDIVMSKRAMMENNIQGYNILVYPGSSVDIQYNKELAKRYFDLAITPEVKSVNNGVYHNRYEIARFSIDALSESRNSDTIKKEIDNAIANGCWIIFITHVWKYSGDGSEDADGKTLSFSNLFDIINYANSKVKISPVQQVWRERKIMWEYYKNFE